ncbi:alpha/beta hydrolase family protein [Undibacterium sp. Di27W]
MSTSIIRISASKYMHMCALLLSLSLLAATPGISRAQDGRLLDTSTVELKEEDLKKLQANIPDLPQILAAVDIQAITYLSDGLKIKGYMLSPRVGSKLPAIIFNRGGNGTLGAVTDTAAAAVLARIASWGYVVVASNYRGSMGSEGKDEFGGRDVNDVLNLLPLLKENPQVDSSRIGMVGRSRGAINTYLALTRTDQITAAVVDAGVTDLSGMLKDRPEMGQVLEDLIPDYAKDKAAAEASRSAILWVDKLNKKTPLLLTQGSADWRVNPARTLTMASKLLENKHPFRLVMFDGGDHSLTEHRKEADRLMREWLDRYVRDKEALPNLEPHGR